MSEPPQQSDSLAAPNSTLSSTLMVLVAGWLIMGVCPWLGGVSAGISLGLGIAIGLILPVALGIATALRLRHTALIIAGFLGCVIGIFEISGTERSAELARGTYLELPSLPASAREREATRLRLKQTIVERGLWGEYTHESRGRSGQQVARTVYRALPLVRTGWTLDAKITAWLIEKDAVGFGRKAENPEVLTEAGFVVISNRDRPAAESAAQHAIERHGLTIVSEPLYLEMHDDPLRAAAKAKLFARQLGGMLALLWTAGVLLHWGWWNLLGASKAASTAG